MKTSISIYVIVLLLLSTCNYSPSTSISPETYRHYLKQGAEIAMEAQKTLLANVSKTMQAGGSENAVGYCHIRALPIVDSLSHAHQCKISRITDKNRNPNNGLDPETDQEIWNFYAAQAPPVIMKDTLLITGNNSLVYYKPISIAVPTCLKCHGIPGNDINETTLAKLNLLYPNDVARNYHAGELRGLWKITFE